MAGAFLVFPRRTFLRLRYSYLLEAPDAGMPASGSYCQVAPSFLESFLLLRASPLRVEGSQEISYIGASVRSESALEE